MAETQERIKSYQEKIKRLEQMKVTLAERRKVQNRMPNANHIDNILPGFKARLAISKKSQLEVTYSKVLGVVLKSMKEQLNHFLTVPVHLTNIADFTDSDQKEQYKPYGLLLSACKVKQSKPTSEMTQKVLLTVAKRCPQLSPSGVKSIKEYVAKSMSLTHTMLTLLPPTVVFFPKYYNEPLHDTNRASWDEENEKEHNLRVTHYRPVLLYGNHLHVAVKGLVGNARKSITPPSPPSVAPPLSSSPPAPPLSSSPPTLPLSFSTNTTAINNTSLMIRNFISQAEADNEWSQQNTISSVPKKNKTHYNKPNFSSLSGVSTENCQRLPAPIKESPRYASPTNSIYIHNGSSFTTSTSSDQNSPHRRTRQASEQLNAFIKTDDDIKCSTVEKQPLSSTANVSQRSETLTKTKNYSHSTQLESSQHSRRNSPVNTAVFSLQKGKIREKVYNGQRSVPEERDKKQLLKKATNSLPSSSKTPVIRTSQHLTSSPKPSQSFQLLKEQLTKDKIDTPSRCTSLSSYTTTMRSTYKDSSKIKPQKNDPSSANNLKAENNHSTSNKIINKTSHQIISHQGTIGTQQMSTIDQRIKQSPTIPIQIGTREKHIKEKPSDIQQIKRTDLPTSISTPPTSYNTNPSFSKMFKPPEGNPRATNSFRKRMYTPPRNKITANSNDTSRYVSSSLTPQETIRTQQMTTTRQNSPATRRYQLTEEVCGHKVRKTLTPLKGNVTSPQTVTVNGSKESYQNRLPPINKGQLLPDKPKLPTHSSTKLNSSGTLSHKHSQKGKKSSSHGDYRTK